MGTSASSASMAPEKHCWARAGTRLGPDGARLAFTSAEGISVMREDGSGATTLVRHDFRDDTDAESDQGVGKPSWSPDGDRIAFEHRGDGDMMPAQIFVMNADGSDLRRVTSTPGGQYAESDPAWSPDGSEIVFWSFGYGIAVVSAAGGTPRQIYQIGPAVAYGAKPVWSPDGTTILFAAYQLYHRARPSGSSQPMEVRRRLPLRREPTRRGLRTAPPSPSDASTVCRSAP